MKKIFQLRWTVIILAEIHMEKGIRFVPLVNRLHISRSVLTTALKHLMKEKVVMRNPGHGHPLRPEYILTSQGALVAPFCAELTRYCREIDHERILLSRWALRIIFAIGKGDVRFSTLKQKLTPITSKALSDELKVLQDEGFVARKLVDEHPPSTLYSTSVLARPLIEIYRSHAKIIEG